MGKRSPIAFAKPKSDTTGITAERVDVFAKAMEEEVQGSKTATPANEPAKKQRSRKGLVSTSIWASKEARLELKIHAQKSDTTMEQYILDAINEKLEKDGGEFRIR